MAELIIVVFELGRPRARECPLDPAARGKAEARIQAFKVERDTGERAGDTVLVACPGGAALDIEQPAVDRISEARGYARKEIRPRGHNRGLAGQTQWETDARAAFHGRPRDGTLDAYDPTRGQLVIAADLPADYGSGRADIGRGRSRRYGPARKRILHQLYRGGDCP